MSTCSSNADCLHTLYFHGNTSGERNWCVQATHCDPKTLHCVMWPRCGQWSAVGCLSTPQECVDYRYEHWRATDGSTTATITYWATMQTPVVLLTTLVMALLVLILSVALIMGVWYKLCRRKARAMELEETTRVPLVSLDATAAAATASSRDDGPLLHYIQGLPVLADTPAMTTAQWTQLYYDRALFY